MGVGEPRLGGGDETIRNQDTTLASEMTGYRGVPDSVLPRQRKRILRKFITVRDVKRGGQRRLLADLVRSKYLGDFQHLGLIGLQIGDRDRTVGCTKVDAKTETCAHELKVFGCVVCKTFGAGRAVFRRVDIGFPAHFGRRDARQRALSDGGRSSQLTSVRPPQAQLLEAGRRRPARCAEVSPTPFSSRDGRAFPRTALPR